jgi:hypothetical protein
LTDDVDLTKLLVKNLVYIYEKVDTIIGFDKDGLSHSYDEAGQRA